VIAADVGVSTSVCSSLNSPKGTKRPSHLMDLLLIEFVEHGSILRIECLVFSITEPTEDEDSYPYYRKLMEFNHRCELMKHLQNKKSFLHFRNSHESIGMFQLIVYEFRNGDVAVHQLVDPEQSRPISQLGKEFTNRGSK
jgi:hypothetical protein